MARAAGTRQGSVHNGARFPRHRKEPLTPSPYQGRLEGCEGVFIGKVGVLRPIKILDAVSHALDMTEGQPSGHCR